MIADYRDMEDELCARRTIDQPPQSTARLPFFHAPEQSIHTSNHMRLAEGDNLLVKLVFLFYALQ